MPPRARTAPLTVFLALCALVLAAPSAHADRATEGRAFIETSINEFLEVLRQKDVALDKRLNQVEALALERFDLDLMTKLVLGKNRRKLNAAQQVEFRDAFRDHIAITYGDNLESYSDERVEVISAREENNGDVSVETKIVGGKVDGAIIVYRLRSKDGAPWRVIDVLIEGVSTIQNFRAQVQDIVSNKGASQLISTIQKKNASQRNAQAAPASEETE